MAKVFIPDPRWEMPELLYSGRKPTGPVEIDWSNPLTVGLKLAVVPTTNDARNLCDTSSSINAGVGGVGVRLAEGWTLLHPAAEEAYRDTIQLDDTYSKVTVLTSFSTLYGAVDHALVCPDAFAVGTEVQCWADTDSSALRLGLFAGTAVYGGEISSNNSDFTPIGYSLEYTGTFTEVQGYVRGLQVIPPSNAGASSSWTNEKTWQVGAAGNGARIKHAIGRFSYIFMWGRVLSAQEHATLGKNPYQFLIPA